jgi:hypothetical protein
MISRNLPIALIILGLSFALLLPGCSQTPPLERFQAQLASAPEYSIILEDMQEEGTFFTSYYHRYRIVQGDTERTTDWMEVSESDYRANENFLGMTLASKTADGVNTSPHPPGYDYVGNPQYGQWQTGSGGRSFWEFYGQYALMRDLLGMGGGMFYRSDYNSYRSYRSQYPTRPYYGSTGREYGTSGTVTQRTKPSFFRRRQARDTARRERFQQKVQRRVSRGGYSSRGGGFGFGK